MSEPAGRLFMPQTHDSIEHEAEPTAWHIQWNLGIRDTQGTVKSCPEF